MRLAAERVVISFSSNCSFLYTHLEKKQFFQVKLSKLILYIYVNFEFLTTHTFETEITYKKNSMNSILAKSLNLFYKFLNKFDKTF